MELILLIEPKNKELYKTLKALVTKAFLLLDEKVRTGERYNPRILESVPIDGTGRLTVLPPYLRNYETVPDFSRFVTRYGDEISELSEWTQAVERLHRDEIINLHLKHQKRSPFGGSVINELNLLYGFVAGSVDENNPFHLNEDTFNSFYGNMEEYFYSETVTQKSICLLLGFDSEVEEINLRVGLKIRRVSKDEIAELWRRSKWFRGMEELADFGFPPLKYVLELFNESPKLSGDEEYSPKIDPNLEFEIVISSLRLFKGGWVDFPFIVQKVSPTLSSETMYSMKHSKRTVHANMPWEISYNLSKEEAEALSEFYRRTHDKIDCSKIPLRRFNETFSRLNVEDKLVDYMISFESLYLSREDRGKLAYKLAHRASRILSIEKEKRKQIFQEMKIAYSIRSDIVHGEKVGTIKIANKEYTLSDFVQIIEEHLRSSLKLFLEKRDLFAT